LVPFLPFSASAGCAETCEGAIAEIKNAENKSMVSMVWFLLICEPVPFVLGFSPDKVKNVRLAL